jgi:putative transposase
VFEWWIEPPEAFGADSVAEDCIGVFLSAFATLSDGTETGNPRHYRETQAELRRAQRKVARRKRGSHNRKKAVCELQRVQAHIRNQRPDFRHTLVNQYGLIAEPALSAVC